MNYSTYQVINRMKERSVHGLRKTIFINDFSDKIPIRLGLSFWPEFSFILFEYIVLRT